MAKRILVVDDAPIIRLMVKDILQYNGYEVCGEGANGKEAVEKYKELKPDLVTLDIIMPEMDGIEALKEILAYDSAARVVMVTAIDQRESLIKAIRIGATDYIVKPFENERVISAVKKALSES
ncbi:MAG TPA: response regulator [Candidatus Omnitrophota bacterium]|nr:response regulator [Candidatus Omnitrophota bacterium]HPS20111.1 response regulator [Candidatus Omnitrophota bacterium]